MYCPLRQKNTWKIICSCMTPFICCIHLHAQPKPRLEITPTQTVSVADLNRVADSRTFSIDNLKEVIYRDPQTHQVIKRESNYSLSASGLGNRNTIVFYDGGINSPNYMRSVTTDANNIPINAIEKIEVLKSPQSYEWSSTGGVINAIRYSDRNKAVADPNPPASYQPVFQVPGYTAINTKIDNSSYLLKISAKFSKANFTETVPNFTYGNGGTTAYTYKPFAGYTNVETETVQFRDPKGMLRKEIYTEYYRDGFAYEEITYYDCNGKPVHFESSVYDEYGDEWEYMEIEYKDGVAVGGYRDITGEDEIGFYEFREYYNPVTHRFEEKPSGTIGWSLQKYSFPVRGLNNLCNRYPEHVFFAGPSLIREDYSQDDKLNMWGAMVNYSWFIDRRFGATLEIGYNRGSIQMNDYSKLNLMGGITYVPCNRVGLQSDFTVSVHALAGMQFLKSEYSFGNNSFSNTDNAFTLALGPRLDYKFSGSIGAGLGIDYNPVFTDNNTANNFRLSAGIRFDFYQSNKGF